eukprot:2642433-Prymnesium_polylepis.1
MVWTALVFFAGFRCGAACSVCSESIFRGTTFGWWAGPRRAAGGGRPQRHVTGSKPGGLDLRVLA